ncbi:hypothetical protein F5Y19DRAFT_477886 [Xylariaceae sp. FL1651]|nr:hypothetical protein F5Y19DRAFT_477886 [Xylariaceae sp. FL1651]
MAVESIVGQMLSRDVTNLHILDVGCGPGTITLDLAAYVPNGSVTGFDLSASAIDSAHYEECGVKDSLTLLDKLATNAGRVMFRGQGREFARRAGFNPDDISASAAPVTYPNSADRNLWGENMASRLESSSDRQKGVELGFVTEDVAASMTKAWRECAKTRGAFYCMVDGQIICIK